MATKSKTKTNTKRKSPVENGKSVAQIVVSKLIERIEEAQDIYMPWQKSHKGGYVNWYTGREYKGINLFLLYGGSGEFVTFKQLKEYNDKNKTDFRVIKGRKSRIVVFVNATNKLISEEKAKELIGKGYGNYVKRDKEGNYYNVRFNWIYYNVFDIRDIENSKGEKLPSKMKQNTDETEYPNVEEVINKYINATGIKVKEDNANLPYYTHIGDIVSLPSIERFVNNNRYYNTFCHELTHSTGIKNRLNRKCFYDYHDSKQERGREELIAEVGANLLLNACGVEVDGIYENSANYVAGWCHWMADHPEEVLRGMMEAEKACEFILAGGKKKEYADKEASSETSKKTYKETIQDLLKASHENNGRGKRTWERLLKSGLHLKLLRKDKISSSDVLEQFKFKLEGMFNGEPLLSMELKQGMKLYCGMTFALMVNETGDYRLLYSIERGNTIQEAQYLAKKYKITALELLTANMNLRQKIKLQVDDYEE